MNMKERGIIFNAEMVRAILDGRKTQTRRVMKVQPMLNGDRWEVYSASVEKGNKSIPVTPWGSIENNCPFGKVGDRLWVRETWRKFDFSDECGCSEYPCGCPENGAIMYRATQDDGESKWRPSIHMPRRYSRITLEITDVRVERLNDISRSDAIAEGAPPSHPTIDAISRECGFPDFSRSWFGQTWWHIYGKKNWQDNPWVWVIEFKRI